MPRYSYQCEWVRCGKRNCRSCPHGPYWYGYWSEKGKTRKRYFGRNDPREPERMPPEEPAEEPVIDWREPLFNRRTVSESLARRVLGVSPLDGRDACFAAYKRLTLDAHPDRGGDSRDMAYLNAAWSYLKACNSWK